MENFRFALTIFFVSSQRLALGYYVYLSPKLVNGFSAFHWLMCCSNVTGCRDM